MSKGHYVCDVCGTYWTSRYETQRCINCGSLAIWRFPRPIAALEHAAHIKERRHKGVADRV